LSPKNRVPNGAPPTGAIHAYPQIAREAATTRVVRHYTVLQDFYENIFGGFNIHFPLWCANTTNAAEGALNSNRLLAEVSRLHAEQSVLDAGCGLGGPALWLAKNYGVHVTAISLAESNIRRCRQIAEQEKLDHLVEFHVLDFMQNPFQPNSFDAIWNLESFIYALPKADYIHNTYRILKPGGIWACLDAFIDPTVNDKPARQMRFQRVNDGFALIDEHWESVSSLRLTLAQAGFDVIKWTDLTSCVLRAPRRPYLLALCRVALDFYTLVYSPELYRLRLKSFLAAANVFQLMKQKAVVYGMLTGQKSSAERS
jgi:tocopherol O-methyltransferase